MDVEPTEADLDDSQLAAEAAAEGPTLPETTAPPAEVQVAADNATNAVAELLKTDEAKAHPEEAERLHQLTDALRKAVKSNETTLIELSFIGIEALLDGMNLPLMFGTVITVKLALMAGKVAMAVYHDHKGHHHLHRRMAH